ncbi:MAG: hypothetical protein KKB82_06195 [Candidatus Omnitrophica bacterium]|nr:hypothetical protein [Candidatus Omnitrophota bacterium]
METSTIRTLKVPLRSNNPLELQALIVVAAAPQNLLATARRETSTTVPTPPHIAGWTHQLAAHWTLVRHLSSPFLMPHRA